MDYATLDDLIYKTRNRRGDCVKVDREGLTDGAWIPLAALEFESRMWLEENNPTEGQVISLTIEEPCARRKGLI